MNLRFFPRDKLFWQYHGGALFLLLILQAATMSFWKEARLINALGAALWVPSYTVGVLFFRYMYKKYEMQNKSMARQIIGVFLYGLIAGTTISVIVLSVLIPLRLDVLLNNPAVVENKMTVAEAVLQSFIGNTMQNHLLLCAWIFIYINISGGRRIREAEINNLRLQNSLKEAQLANLSNQLNPHFLFNALNNIRFTIHEDQNKADAMLTGISEMLRYSLESSKQEKVILTEELHMIDRYIALIKVQMENRLNFCVNIPNDIKECLIPPMVLQLLVENAVKHGIDKLRDGGTITLSAVVDNQKLIFSIINTRGNTNAILPESSSSTGIGLVNIQSRLRLLYGNLAQLTTEELEKSFVVSLTLPREI